MPIAVGPAARLTEQLHELPKRYLAFVLFGIGTDTDDLGGRISASSPVTPAPWQVRAALSRFSGAISQIPPAYSAVHVAGQRAYDLARAGSAPVLKARPVIVHSISAPDFSYWPRSALAGAGLAVPDPAGRLVAAIDVSCSAGTYIRSIARDLGEALGTCACLAGLLRTHSGPFGLTEAVRLEQAVALAKADSLAHVVFAPDSVLGPIAPILLDDELSARFSNGARSTIAGPPGRRRVYAIDGRFLGLGELTADGLLHPRRVLEAA